jgi:hypothetical protein
VRRLLVTIGSDGATNWVKLPDGQRFNLGPISILSFATQLSSGSTAKKALQQFTSSGEALISVDEEKMWDMLAPRPPRLATEGPFIYHDRRDTMSGIHQQLDALKGHLHSLGQKDGSPEPQDIAMLKRLATLPSPAKYPEFYGLSSGRTASENLDLAETYRDNSELAEKVLDLVASTADRIDQLVEEGKKFNAARARQDLYEVSTKVASIVGSEVIASWVQEDLRVLEKRALKIHQLFTPKD